MNDEERKLQEAIVGMDKKRMDEPRILELRARAKRCCCKSCGENLALRRITYGQALEGRIEIFCSTCNRIEYGVEPEIYRVASYFIDEIQFDHYPDLEPSLRKNQMNICKVSDIISWGCVNLGLLNAQGFILPLSLAEELVGENLLVTDADLEKYEAMR